MRAATFLLLLASALRCIAIELKGQIAPTDSAGSRLPDLRDFDIISTDAHAIQLLYCLYLPTRRLS